MTQASLSTRITSINAGGSDGWDVFHRARKMIADGIPVIELTIGEHDIRTDPAIAVKIIRIANSAAFARPEPVTTPLEAVRRLGLQQIRQNVINLEIMDNFSVRLFMLCL